MLAGMGKATTDALLEWMRANIGRGKKRTAKGLAELLNLDAAQVTRILNGRQLRVGELEIIEQYIGERAPSRDNKPVHTRVDQIEQSGEIPVVNIVAPGVWREAGAVAIVAERVSAVRDSRLARVDQYACTVEAEPMRTVICAPYAEMRRRPEVDDLVHVVRFEGRLEEHTLRVVRERAGDYWLAPEKSPADVASYVKFPQKPDKGIEVRGLVIADMIRRRY